MSNLVSSIINIWWKWLYEWAFGDRFSHRMRENTSNSLRLLKNQIYSCWCFKTASTLTLSWKRSHSQSKKIKARWSPADSNFKICSVNLFHIKVLHFLLQLSLCCDHQTHSKLFPFIVTYVNSLVCCFHFIKPSQMFPPFFMPESHCVQCCGADPGPCPW